jgi:hypothetical protein
MQVGNGLRRRLWALALVCLCGCGGGNGGGGGNPPPGGGSDARGVLMASIEAKAETFDGTNMHQENQQMLAFLQTKPEFVETGVGADGAWGKFADGTFLAVGNNLDAVSDTRQAPPAIIRSSRPGRSRDAGLPSSKNIMLGTSLGDWYEGFLEPYIPPLFEGQGYQRVKPDASVEALKNLNNVAVLHLFGHGFLLDVRKPAPKLFVAWTSTLRTTALDAQYKSDLDDGSLVYVTSLAFHTDTQTPVKKRWETHYAFTHKFVTKYWSGKFDPNSLVFMNTCNSANLDALEFQFACLNAGASYYLGWSERMKLGEAVGSAAYLFDRLLGSNTDKIGGGTQETPPQRPFSIMPVLVEMGTRMRSTAPYAFDTTLPPPEEPGGPGVYGKLMFLTINGKFQQLAPSIEGLTVDEQKDELTINGSFGEAKGTAFMGTTALTVKAWDANKIVCTLPRSGAGSSGDVTVQTPNPLLSSNTVQLTEWNGTVTCTFEGKGSIRQVMQFNVHFRADVHDRRIQPHGTPFMSGAGFLQALDTHGTFETSGNYISPDGLIFEEWSGSGAIPSFIKPPDGTSPPEVTNVVVQGSFDEDRKWSLAVRAVAKSGNRVHTIIKDTQGKIVSDKTEDHDAVWLSVGDMNGNINLVTAGPDYSVPGGTKTLAVGTDESLTLEWSSMTAINPPKADSARSVKRRSRR